MIVLDAAFLKTKGGEAATAVACLERNAPLLPGAQAVVYDTALRGTHHQTILRTLGLIPINRVAAAQAGSKSAWRNKRDQRVEKLVFVEQKSVELPDGSTAQVDLYARSGALGLGVLAADGELVFTPLPASAPTATLTRAATAVQRPPAPGPPRRRHHHRSAPRRRQGRRPEVQPDRERQAYPA